MASHIVDASSGDFLSSGQRDRARAFRAAMRHSRFVRIMRVAIPLLVVGIVSTFVTYRWLDPMSALAKLPVGAEGLVISGTKIIMRQPRLAGFTKDERPYTIVARTAAKDLANPDALEMQDVHAKLVMQDQRNVEVTSKDGFYDGKANTIRLWNNVIVSSTEYEALMSDALMHVRAGHVVSEKPVVVNMLPGTINANRLEIIESGAVIRFEGGVTMLLDREDAPAAATGTIR